MLGRWQQRQDTCMVNMQNVSVACLGRANDSHRYKQPHPAMHNGIVQLMSLMKVVNETNHVHALLPLKQYKARWSILLNLEQHLTMMKGHPIKMPVIINHQLHLHTPPHIDTIHLPVIIVVGDHAAEVTQGSDITDITGLGQEAQKEEDAEVAVGAQRDIAINHIQDQKLHTTDLIILTLDQEPDQDLQYITGQGTNDHAPVVQIAAAVELLAQ